MANRWVFKDWLYYMFLKHGGLDYNMNINLSYSDGTTNVIVVDERDLIKIIHEFDDHINSFTTVEIFKQKGDVRPY